MNIKYIDTTKVGNIDFDNIIPALDKKSDDNELRPILNIADPAMLVEATFERFDESTTVKPLPLGPLPMNDRDKIISYAIDNTAISHIQSKVVTATSLDNDAWAKWKNIEQSPFVQNIPYVANSPINWQYVLKDHTLEGRDYKGLLNLRDDNQRFVSTSTGMPIIQFVGEPGKSNGIRALYSGLADMQTRFFSWELSLSDTEYQHSNPDYPFADDLEGHLFAWGSHITPGGFISDEVTASPQPLATLAGAIDSNSGKFANLKVLMTYESYYMLRVKIGNDVIPLTYFFCYNTLEDQGALQMRFDRGESAIFPPKISRAYISATVVGSPSGNGTGKAMNTAVVSTRIYKTAHDWTTPFKPSDGQGDNLEIQEIRTYTDLTHCYLIADKVLSTDLAKYYD